MKLKLLFIVLLFITQVTFAKVTVNLSQNSAGIDDDFSVTFTYQGNSGQYAPDFSKLKKDFKILSSSQNSQISIINGQIRRQVEWRLILNAKQAGNYKIPAITFGNERSQATKISITKQSTLPASDIQNNIFMKADVNNLKPYVQQQITYKVRMFYKIRPTSGDFTSPTADNALLTPLGESQNYQANIKGQTYHVVEQNYAIFAEKSGPLSIASPVFKGLVRRININDINQIMMDLHQPIKIAAANVKLDIQAIPSSFNGSTWLPANEVSLKESWQEENSEIKTGQPITRIIHLKALGLMASQLPELSFGSSIKGAKVYAEPSSSSDEVAGSRIIGEKEFKIVYIPTGKQDIEIPEIKVSWWDLDNKQLKVAKLNKTSFIVSNKSAPTQKTTPLSKTKNKTNNIQTIEPKKSLTNLSSINKPQSYFNFTTMLPWSLVIILSLSLFLYHLKRKTGNKIDNKSKFKNFNSIKNLKKQLKVACIENNTALANTTLIQWAKLNYPESVIRQLSDVKNIINNKTFSKQLEILQQVLYGADDKWHGQALWQSFLTINNKKSRKANHNDDQLPMFN